MEPSTWLRWIECHPGLSGYLQVLGTMLALFVAIGAPLLIELAQRRNIRRERRVRAASLLKAVASDVGIAATRAILLAGPISGATLPKFQSPNWVDTLRLELPPRLERVVFEATDIDRDVLAPITKIVNAASEYNGFLEIIKQGSFASPAAFNQMFFDLDKRRNKVVEHAEVLIHLYASKVPLEGLADPSAQEILDQ
jgi:hypothetical protein